MQYLESYGSKQLHSPNRQITSLDNFLINYGAVNSNFAFVLQDASSDFEDAEVFNSAVDNISTQSVAATVTSETNETLDQLLYELDGLTGLETAKNEVRTFIRFVQVRQHRAKRGLQISDLSLHSVFYGAPGTGKTTMARLYARIFRCLGLLSKGHLVETDRAGLVANYVGQTATKTDEKIREASGGVLFIDEAYSLFRGDDSKDYGTEAVEILLKRMEDYRNDMAVVIAGYPEPMEKLLESNPGLLSRFTNFLHFESYNLSELCQIFARIAHNEGFSLTDEANEKAKNVIAHYHSLQGPTFGNARFIRNLVEATIRSQAERVSTILDVINDNDLQLIDEVDVPARIALGLRNQ